MKTITLRNLPPELARLIEDEAQKRGASLNKTVIRLLEETLVLSRGHQSRNLHHDLDELAGKWSEEEAREFDENLARQRKLDRELWS